MQVRPTAAVLAWKSSIQQHVAQRYESSSHYILHTIFGLKPQRSRPQGKLFVSTEQLASLPPPERSRLAKNLFPYSVPRGTEHCILWCLEGQRSDEQICTDITSALQERAKGIASPPSPSPDIAHAQTTAPPVGARAVKWFLLSAPVAFLILCFCFAFAVHFF